ncbi:hypothetical protein SAMN05660463_04359 [Pseudomonas sp. URIL14HWK12:I9]|nr:hypothetical protein F474_03058 [Pseudomonas sp. URIL14HWK12:I12]PVZ23578.1 hypothetical protein F470_03144 [Pseudomonas sp. URIL14HWK12:I10]PVZ32908.1 hypothetical protein F472_03492 [Pseudomonas sp. URIL14HWK12:I11]SNZ18776.1 hypothetical protein SAMN05660463_04359 [Pseudomonas sp. URIL14HWK12:I9]
MPPPHRSRAVSVRFALSIVLSIGALPLAAQSQQSDNSRTLPIPPRLQWYANFGYCGEVSFISAGLYYGQYISQYEARRIASNNAPQAKEKSQLLLGVNDARAARLMHLNAVQWDTSRTENPRLFLAWVKRNIAAGYPAVIGVYMNQHLAENNQDPDAGQAEYDHIVPVRGFTSSHPITTTSGYYEDDTLLLSDNGLWNPGRRPKYNYRYTLSDFLASRRDANSPEGEIYSLAKSGGNYGIAITGIVDRDHQALPVRVATDVNDERPSMTQGSSQRPPSQIIHLTVTVSGLRPGVAYRLYRYDQLASVPDAHFNAKAADAAQSWNIPGGSQSTYVLNQTIDSDEVAVYRAVPATAP